MLAPPLLCAGVRVNDGSPCPAYENPTVSHACVQYDIQGICTHFVCFCDVTQRHLPAPHARISYVTEGSGKIVACAWCFEHTRIQKTHVVPHAHTCTRTHAHARTRAHARTHTRTHTHTCTHAHAHTHTPVPRAPAPKLPRSPPPHHPSSAVPFVIRRLSRTIRHRGPDGSGIHMVPLEVTL